MQIVIMAGGSGTRLWPLSRTSYPKQFIKIFNNHSLFQQTVIRNKFKGLAGNPVPIIITHEDYRFIVAEQLKEINQAAEIILEPMAKNTAACAVLGSLLTLEKKCDTLLIASSDHYIPSDSQNQARYQNDILIAKKAAEAGYIVTLGIKPDYPSCSYGYIKANDKIDSYYKVEKFIEKPSFETAKEYISQGSDYWWNSGIFIASCNVILQAASRLEPKLLNQVKKSLTKIERNSDFIRIPLGIYKDIREISFDYAILEKYDNIALVPAQFEWHDIGNWSSLSNLKEKDFLNNNCIGNVVAQDTTNCYTYSDSDRLITLINIHDLIVVDMEDALLIMNQNSAEQVKLLVNKLTINNKEEVKYHKKIHRPWGYYKIINIGELYKVKKIVIHPDHKISLQYHQNRAETWIIIKGVALAEVGSETKILKKNDSVYIPQGMKHRLTNICKMDLEIIEVQTGNYLQEDDIVRLDDAYGR